MKKRTKTPPKPRQEDLKEKLVIIANKEKAKETSRQHEKE